MVGKKYTITRKVPIPKVDWIICDKGATPGLYQCRWWGIKMNDKKLEPEDFQVIDSPVQKLRKIMKHTGWNQEKMASLLKVSQGQISNYLKGKSEMSIHVEDILNLYYDRIFKRGLILRGFSPNGGTCRIERRQSYVSHGGEGMNQQEFTAFEKACLVADPINGGDWEHAEKILKDAGFEVLYE
jgi:transcriptional regulator with XRE-family HTH domain